MASSEDEDEPKFCTCCGDEDDGQLVHPCDCRGSAKWIHEHCLEAMQSAGPWVAAAHRCDQCMNEHFGALYDELSARVQAECMNGEASPNTLSALASELRTYGRYDEAEQLIHEAVGLLRENLGDWHPATVNTIPSHLGFLLGKALSDRYKPLLREAVAVEWLREKFGDRHPATLTCINDLGALLYKQGGRAAAEPLLREASGLWVRYRRTHQELSMASREDEDETPFCIFCGGEDDGRDFCAVDPPKKWGCGVSAKWIHKDCLETRNVDLSARVQAECTNGQASPNTLSALASELRTFGRYDEAEQLIREAVVLLRENLGDRHPATLSTIPNHLGFLLGKDLPDRYEPMLREAVAVEWLREKFGDQHPVTLTSINILGALLCEQGEFAAALPLLREALQGHRERLGDRHPDTLCCISNLAGLLHEKRDLVTAERLYREAIEGMREILGDRHPDTRCCISNLAALLRETAADLAQSRGHATVAEAVRGGSSTYAAAAGAAGPAEGAIPSTGKETFSGMNNQDKHDTSVTTSSASTGSPCLRRRCSFSTAASSSASASASSSTANSPRISAAAGCVRPAEALPADLAARHLDEAVNLAAAPSVNTADTSASASAMHPAAKHLVNIAMMLLNIAILLLKLLLPSWPA